MKIVKEFLSTLTIIYLISGVFALQVGAVIVIDENEEVIAQSEESNADNDKKEEAQADRCDRLTEGVANKVQKYEKVYEAHSNAYKNSTEKMSGLIARLQGLGLDTSELEAVLADFEPMMLQFENNYQETLQNTEQMQLAGCDGDRDGYNEARKEVTTQVNNMRKTSNEIKHAMQNEFKDILRDLHDQMQELLKDSNSSIEPAE